MVLCVTLLVRGRRPPHLWCGKRGNPVLPSKVEARAVLAPLRLIKRCWLVVSLFVLSCTAVDIKQKPSPPPAPTGALEIHTEPEGAQIYLDGQPVGHTPKLLERVAVGPHRVELVLAPYARAVQEIQLGPERRLLHVRLELSWGALEIVTRPEGASVSLDGMPRGATPLILPEIPVGEHHLLVAKPPGYRPQERRLSIQPGHRETVVIDLEPHYGTVSITSNPVGAAIFVAGTPYGKTPQSLQLPPGTYHVLVQKEPLYLPQERRIVVQPGEETGVFIALDPAYGTLTITSDPPGAAVSVAGNPQGKTPQTVQLPPGTYRVVVQMGEPYHDFEQTVTVQRGVEHPLVVVFRKKVASLAITSNPPNAEVTLDKELKGPTPLTLNDVPAGKHDIVLRKDHLGFRGALEVKAGSENSLHADLVPIRPPADQYVLIPAGRFRMGSGATLDAPAHWVTLHDYWMGKYEITVDEYKQCMMVGTCQEPGQGPHCTWGKPERGHHPINCVSWGDAATYAAWLSGTTGLPYQLPTEAQWEKAARGTDGRLYPWGEQWDGPRANFCDRHCKAPGGNPKVDDGFAETAPVGRYEEGKSPYGVYDMAGNVAEWCRDYYAPDFYRRAPPEHPWNDRATAQRVVRGGGWDLYEETLRSDLRSYALPSERDAARGFRLVVEGTEHFRSALASPSAPQR